MPLNIDWQQILLHLFNFVLLFTILFLLIYRPVKKFMEKRNNYYKEMDEQAKQNLLDSENSKEEYKNKLKNVDSEINTLRDEAIKQANDSAEQIINNAKQESSKIIANAKDDAKKEQAEAIKNAGEEISKMVSDATKKIVFEDTSSAYDNFLNTVEGSDDNEK